jgi:integrase/recombinase XerD
VTALAEQVQEYLSMRRGLGFKLEFPGQVLPQFVAFLDARGASTVTVELAVAWAGLPQGAKPISLAHRLGAVRGFARYLRTIDPATEVPPCGIWRSVAPRPTPYLWTDDDIAALVDAAQALRPLLRAATHAALFGLLAASGMRVGEALGLGRDDVDLCGGVVTIREAKFDRSRLVPLHPTTTEALGSYARCRDLLCPAPRSTTFFVSGIGTALDYAGVYRVFVELTTAIGLRSADLRPRLHDLRHTFAVRTLVNWYRGGIDVEGRMAVLSNYLGHVNPAGTYWYLSASPELMELAAAQLDGRSGARR